jgi:hypothetical protein
MPQRNSKRLTVSAASVPPAARTAVCGIATVRPTQPTMPYQEKIGEVSRFLTGSWSAAMRDDVPGEHERAGDLDQRPEIEDEIGARGQETRFLPR